ncbi:UvrD-helicase domain-containing protein [Candidatus Fermentibacterales bacterium]|nr:UvrD-helicase domain-containing protein [Candidatus Fermentibacterales bacterium]
MPSPSTLFEASLNDRQLEAVTHESGPPLLVLAGAGSGKTRVITYRIAYLLERSLAPPWGILAMTFTRKAAREMQERVATLVPADVAARLRMGTFHSMCAWLLRKGIEGLNCGRDRDYVIYDRDDSLSLLRRIARERGGSDPSPGADPASCMRMISRCKSGLIDPAEWTDASLSESVCREMRAVYDGYEAGLRQSNAIDFDDILTLCLGLLRRNNDAGGAARPCSGMFSHILVDEYQDTNRVQHLILRELASKETGICVVGDDDQSIYGWRGARVANLLDFGRDFPGTRIIRMERNYRSTGNILKAASTLVSYNRARHSKTLWSEAPPGDPVRELRFATASEEAAWIVQSALDLRDRLNVPLGSIAVLFRTNAQSRELELQARKAGVPYELVGSLRFFERQEIKDTVCYLRLVVNPKDRVSLIRVLSRPRRGIGDKSRQALLQAIDSRPELSPLEVMGDPAGLCRGLSTRAASAMRDLAALLADAAEMDRSRSAGVREIAAFLLTRSGLEDSFRTGLSEDDSRLYNLAELLGMAAQFDLDSPGEGLAEFLAQTSLLTSVDEYDSDAERLALMTLHCSKGLELDTVFICGLEEGLLPLERPARGDARGEMCDIEEERRLLYVGMTRARKRLLLTLSLRRAGYPGRGGFHGRPSRFLSEIGAAGQPAQAPGRDPERVAGLGEDRQGSSEGYRKGDIIRHPRFGQGMVLSARRDGEEWALTVDFGGDEPKTLLTGYVDLPVVARRGSGGRGKTWHAR